MRLIVPWTKFAVQVLKVNGTEIRYIPCELFKFAYMVERSLASLPAYSFSSKAKTSRMKELLKGPTYNPKLYIY